MKEIKNMQWPLLLGGCFLIWLFTKDSGTASWSVTGFSVIIWFLIWSTNESLMWFSRYYSSLIVTQNFHGSINGSELVFQGGYYIFNVGFSEFPFPTRGKLGTVVIPKEGLVKFVGFRITYLSNVFVRRTPLRFLPQETARYLRRHRQDYNLDYIMFGELPEQLMFEHKNLKKFVEEREDLRSQINIARADIEDRNEYLCDQFEKSKQITGESSKLKQFLNQIVKKDQEENDLNRN